MPTTKSRTATKKMRMIMIATAAGVADMITIEGELTGGEAFTASDVIWIR